MKKKTVYIWMGIIVSLTAAAFVAIYFLNLGNEVAKITPRMDPNGPPAFSHLIYGDFDKGALDKPMDVSKVGEFLYISDTKNKRVQVFDAGGTPIFQFGKEGDGPGEFMFPYGISGDKKGRVYVADLFNGTISIFDSKGKFIDYFKEADGKNKVIKAPGGLRIIDEKMYLTDIEKSQVYVFDLNGKLLLTIGKPGQAEGDFRAPNSVTADDEGNIYVVDTGNQRIQIFDKAGKFRKQINGSDDGKGKSTLVNPRGIDIDSRGFIYVVNNLTHYVYAFDQEGKKAFQFGGIGDQNEQFYLPNGLFIDDTDHLYITDTLNQRVAVYY
ncbi:6-bladed beta-propeller [Mesobacillus subterraneus]|uniref:6-bladed beta-propeller n=1 Tax=Mesobacillus subterraneus TaxID=285983 RepID=UPI00203C8E6F|nr:6-bladed beta-propeller [Mesobacillus subterraneus]MCM3663575.1 6-bladed beta-propeller [Mesobacillus subterraneus]MCM3683341.1 6-bladed beta-propeller [Mesobacillus subterraneus]